MESILMQCPVPVKAVLTERLREELLAVELSAAEELARQIGLLNHFATSQDNVSERQQRLALQQAEIQGRIDQVRNAAEGEELLLRVVPTLIELRVGDNFLEKMATEVLLENGVVVAIRAHLPETELEEAELEAVEG